MSTWVLFVVIGQFIYAAVVLVDRFIVAKNVVSKPVVYAFYVNLLSIFAIFAAPFGVTIPSLGFLGLSMLIAISYALSIYFLYESLKKSNASEVVPVVGGVAAITAFMAASVLLGQELPGHFKTGFLILTAGMLLISHFKFTLRSFIFLSGSGIFFGLSTVLIKILFEGDTFINGFFWSRAANVVVALLMLLIPSVWRAVRDDLSHPKGQRNKGVLIIGNKILAAMAFICVLIAIKNGNVAIVSALTASQYVFLLIFALFFRRLLPEYFEEKIHKHEFLHKILATGLIVVGFFVLFV